MEEAELTAELVAALTLDLPEHTAYVLALLAEALAVEARCHHAPTPQTAATLLALNELQHAVSRRLVTVLTYEDAGPRRGFHRGTFREGARPRLRQAVATGGARRGFG